MKELDLHKQWIRKDVPVLDMKLTDGRPVSIVHFGHYNSNLAGPDFSMGIINIDGVELIGPIEMHIKSSDWYQHNHHLDKNYDNVILHVVREHDADIIQNNHLIPTIELLEIPAFNHSIDGIICSSLIGSLSNVSLERMKASALKQKFADRVVDINNQTNGYLREALYFLLARSFGTSVNGEQFSQLCLKIPISDLIGLGESEIFSAILRASNILVDKRKWDPENDILWNFKGLRPASFPSVRVKQFATVCSHLLFNDEFLDECRLLNMEKIERSICALDFEVKPSSSFIQNLMINCFIPFAFQPDMSGNGSSFSDVESCLKSLNPEQNKVVLMWKKYAIEIRSAYDTQSLLELYKTYCNHKKCLSCDIGKELM